MTKERDGKREKRKGVSEKNINIVIRPGRNNSTIK
jgi:hypothetical protein